MAGRQAQARGLLHRTMIMHRYNKDNQGALGKIQPLANTKRSLFHTLGISLQLTTALAEKELTWLSIDSTLPCSKFRSLRSTGLLTYNNNNRVWLSLCWLEGFLRPQTDNITTDFIAIASFYPSQPNGHALPNPQSLPQTSPMQPSRGPPPMQQQQSPPRLQQHSAQAGGYNLSNLGPISHQQRSSPTAMTNERDVERERLREQQLQQDLIAQQQYEQENDIINHQREQQQQREQQREQQHQSPRENHIGAIPIQQPVASRIPASLHGPNGILNDQHSGSTAQAQASASLGALSGPGNVFTNGLQAANDGALRPFAQQATQPVPPHQLLGFSNAVTPQQLPAGVAALSQGLSQGQQPILNVGAPRPALDWSLPNIRCSGKARKAYSTILKGCKAENF